MLLVNSSSTKIRSNQIVNRYILPFNRSFAGHPLTIFVLKRQRPKISLHFSITETRSSSHDRSQWRHGRVGGIAWSLVLDRQKHIFRHIAFWPIKCCNLLLLPFAIMSWSPQLHFHAHLTIEWRDDRYKQFVMCRTRPPIMWTGTRINKLVDGRGKNTIDAVENRNNLVS